MKTSQSQRTPGLQSLLPGNTRSMTSEDYTEIVVLLPRWNSTQDPALLGEIAPETWASRSKLSDDGYHNNGQHRNEPNRSEAKQGEKRSHASGLEQINRHDDGAKEENKTVEVVAKLSAAFLCVGSDLKCDDGREGNSRYQVGPLGKVGVGSNAACDSACDGTHPEHQCWCDHSF